MDYTDDTDFFSTYPLLADTLTLYKFDRDLYENRNA